MGPSSTFCLVAGTNVLLFLLSKSVPRETIFTLSDRSLVLVPCDGKLNHLSVFWLSYVVFLSSTLDTVRWTGKQLEWIVLFFFLLFFGMGGGV